jgi:hypothetical protein
MVLGIRRGAPSKNTGLSDPKNRPDSKALRELIALYSESTQKIAYKLHRPNRSAMAIPEDGCKLGSFH